MSREPFILVKQPVVGDAFRVIGTEADHLIRVLRAGPGFRITGFNGKGVGWKAEVIAVERSEVKCRVIEKLAEPPTTGLNLQVGVGIVKGQRMDWAVEKASETGADVFIPMLSDRSVVKPGSGKIERWRAIALASAKQSKHLLIMEIREPIQLSELISPKYTVNNIQAKTHESNIWAMYYGSGSRVLVDLFQTIQLPSNLTLIFGPEGGYSDEEIGLFKEHKIPLAGMGRRQLRTETAVAVAIGTLKNLTAENQN